MSKVKIHFFTIADYEEEEIWLRKQHQQGLRFVKMVPPCFYVFEECTPEDVVYRLDYKNSSASSDYKQMFQDYGWEYVGDCVGWLYFRKCSSEIQQENDGEIFSDVQSKADMIQHVLKTRMIPLLLIFFCCLIPNWVRSFSGSLGKADYFLMALFSALVVLYLFLIIHCGRKLVKLRGKYKPN